MLTKTKSLSIEGINQTSILRYFETLNAGRFAETAQLFSVNGVLYPPFEDGVVGKDAIAVYLETEAKDLQLFPKTGKVIKTEENNTYIEVRGKVKTPVFGVNVAWIFILNNERSLEQVEVKLLASPQELLSLRDKR